MELGVLRTHWGEKPWWLWLRHFLSLQALCPFGQTSNCIIYATTIHIEHQIFKKRLLYLTKPKQTSGESRVQYVTEPIIGFEILPETSYYIIYSSSALEMGLPPFEYHIMRRGGHTSYLIHYQCDTSTQTGALLNMYTLLYKYLLQFTGI